MSTGLLLCSVKNVYVMGLRVKINFSWKRLKERSALKESEILLGVVKKDGWARQGERGKMKEGDRKREKRKKERQKVRKKERETDK